MTLHLMLHRGINKLISAVKSGNLTWVFMRIDSLLGAVKEVQLLALGCWFHLSTLEVAPRSWRGKKKSMAAVAVPR